MRFWRAAGVICVAWVLVSPVVVALASNGVLVLGGPASFPSGTSLQGTLLACLDVHADQLATLTIDAPSLMIHRFEKGAVEAQSVALQDSYTEETWSLTNVHMSLISSARSGFVGLYPGASTQVFATSTAAETVEPRQTSTISTVDRNVFSKGDTPSISSYYKVVGAPHLLVDAPLQVTAEGNEALKLFGLTVRIDAAENTTTIETGTTHPTPIQRDDVWLYIEMPTGTIHIDPGAAPLKLAISQSAAASWDGTATFALETGSVHTTESDYTAPAPGDYQVDGKYSATLSSLPSREGLQALLTGDLRTTSLHYAPSPILPSGAASIRPWLLLLGLGVVVAGGGSALLVLQRKGVMHPPTRPTRYVERAEEAEDAHQWTAAADLWGHARRLEPSQEGLALREGIAWYFGGESAFAIEALELASRERDDGEAEFWCALCAVALVDDDLAEVYLVRALDRNPTRNVIADMWHDEAFAGIRERASVREAILHVLGRGDL